jgi:ATP-dependent RNA helicase DeaD
MADSNDKTSNDNTSNGSSSSPYTRTIDLRTKTVREKRQKKAQERLTEASGTELDALDPNNLPDRVQQAMRATGWKDLMDVQKQAIPYVLAERDLIVQSRTGSGKTGAFLLPLFEVLDAQRNEPQALILTPTRELAKQIYEEFEQMKTATRETFDLEAVLVYGGVGYGPQIRAFKQGVQVIIGTPGRVLDHLNKKNLILDKLDVLILDEADEMLSMGFYPDMKEIKSFLPDDRISCLFSATVPPKVRALGNEFLRDPSFLSLSTGQVSVEEIEHRYYIVDKMDKDRALTRLIEWENPESAIVFCNTKREVEYLTNFLSNYGYHASDISGDLSQKDREKAMKQIRDGKLRFLVATDVAARGIDISELSHVFQYDAPDDPDWYIHRSGRTARAGRSGTAITLVAFDEEFKVKNVEKEYGVDFTKGELPDEDALGERVAERLATLLRERFEKKPRLVQERVSRFEPTVETLAESHPALLAMLVDEVYFSHLEAQRERSRFDEAEADADAAPDGASAAEARDDKRKQTRNSNQSKSRGKKRGSGRGKGRSGRRSGNRGSRNKGRS